MSREVAKSDSKTNRERADAIIALLEQWMNEDGTYDEELWPILENELKQDRITFREPDAFGS